MSLIEIIIWVVFITFIILIMEPWKIYHWLISPYNDKTVRYDSIEDTVETLESIKHSVRESKSHTTDEVEVNCNKCGAPNKKLDTFCGYCGSMLYIEKTARIKSVELKSIMFRR